MTMTQTKNIESAGNAAQAGVATNTPHNNAQLHIGVDVGSTTVKMLILKDVAAQDSSTAQADAASQSNAAQTDVASQSSAAKIATIRIKAIAPSIFSIKPADQSCSLP